MKLFNYAKDNLAPINYNRKKADLLTQQNLDNLEEIIYSFAVK